MIENKIVDFLKKHKIEPKTVNSRSFIFDCPACGGKKKLYIERKTGDSVCFRHDSDKCPSMGSSPAYSLSLLSGLPIKEVKAEIFLYEEELSSKDEIRVVWDREKIEDEAKTLEPCALPGDAVLITNAKAADGVSYLLKRGVPYSLAVKYSITYSPGMRRVIFPVIMGDKMYGWQGRAIDPVDKEFRMYNLPGPWKTQTLMFYNNLKDKDWAILAEGPISAIKFEWVGGYVASMGKEVSRKQMDLIKEAGIKKLFLALDRDAANKMAEIDRYLNKNGNEVQCYVVPVPENRDDFGDATFEECLDCFLKSEPFNRDGVYVSIDANPKSLKKYMEKK